MAKAGKKQASRGGRGPDRPKVPKAPRVPRSGNPASGTRAHILDWNELKNFFPIKSRDDANSAAAMLLTVGDGDDYWRARAWFAYLCATVVLDWWEFGSESWGDWAGLPRQTFWRRASELADEAVEQMERIDDDYLYDALWAQGFIAVAEGKFEKAIAAYERAIEIGGGGRDAAILAEVADAYVFAGNLQRARTSINAAFAHSAPHPPPDRRRWFYWVRAWVSVAEGAVMPVGQPRVDKGIAAQADIRELENEDGVPRDFDAAITKMLGIYLERGTLESTSDTWTRFKRKVQRKKGIAWNRHLELARSPLKIEVPAARALRDLLMTVVPEENRN